MRRIRARKFPAGGATRAKGLSRERVSLVEGHERPQVILSPQGGTETTEGRLKHRAGVGERAKVEGRTGGGTGHGGPCSNAKKFGQESEMGGSWIVLVRKVI